jgi:hypothetical protein
LAPGALACSTGTNRRLVGVVPQGLQVPAEVEAEVQEVHSQQKVGGMEDEGEMVGSADSVVPEDQHQDQKVSVVPEGRNLVKVGENAPGNQTLVEGHDQQSCADRATRLPKGSVDEVENHLR